MNWKHDWVRFESALVGGVVALLIAGYGIINCHQLAHTVTSCFRILMAAPTSLIWPT